MIDTTMPMDGFGLINGYAKTEKAYTENNRVRRISVYRATTVVHKEVRDSARPQWVTFPGTLQGEIKLVIADYYMGRKYDDVCITEVILDRPTYDAVVFLYSLIETVGSRLRAAEGVRRTFKDFF